MARAHRDPTVVAAKVARLRDPHLSDLTDLVERMRAAHPSAHIPWFDPDSAGVGARALILLEAPGPFATERGRGKRSGSGFISMDNDDPTAAFMHEIHAASGLKRSETLLWNVVPWYIGADDGSRIRRAERQDSDDAEEFLRELLARLPELIVVVLMGGAALAAWQRCRNGLPALPGAVLSCPHPSVRGRRGEGETKIKAVLTDAAKLLRG